MQPNSDQNRGGLQVPSNRGSLTPPTSRQAATNLMRQQIDTIYDEPQPNEVAASREAEAQPAAAAPAPSQTDAARAAQQNAVIQAHWQKYHSAWQQYYQMYYERYYQAEVQKRLQSTTAPAETTAPEPDATKEPEGLTKNQALSELRDELRSKVREQTKKLRKSRHFMPAVVGLTTAVIFVLLQYNQIIFANLMAYTSPAALDTVATYVDPSTDVTVGPEPLLTIPKLAVKAPVVYDLTTLDEQVVETKLQSGVVHYPITGANAVPGQFGNTVILGHSANDVFVAGDYKFVFLRLEQLQKGDQFYLNYNSKRYTYVVTEKKVISPSQVSELAIGTSKPMATLVTCVPVGTSTNRLLVFGEQVAPDPNSAASADTSNTTATQEIGGGTKTFWERLFGG